MEGSIKNILDMYECHDFVLIPVNEEDGEGCSPIDAKVWRLVGKCSNGEDILIADISYQVMGEVFLSVMKIARNIA